jgi:hypothetical protein
MNGQGVEFGYRCVRRGDGAASVDSGTIMINRWDSTADTRQALLRAAHAEDVLESNAAARA